MASFFCCQTKTSHSCFCDGRGGVRAQSYQCYIATHDQDELLDDTIEEIRRQKIMRGEISLLGCMEQVRMMSCWSLKISGLLSCAACLRMTHYNNKEQPLQELVSRSKVLGDYRSLEEILVDPRVTKRLSNVLRPFFDKYDVDRSLAIDQVR